MSGYKIGVDASAGVITTQMIHDAEFDVGRETLIRAINTGDELIKKALIEMGWTPPQKSVGAVLAYSSKGAHGVSGQIIGANGAGEYAHVFYGPPQQAREAAFNFLQKKGERENIKNVIIATNSPDACFLGSEVSFHLVDPI